DEEEDGADEGHAVGSKRKLTSIVWVDFKKVRVRGIWKAQCLHCKKKLGGESKNGTKHLHVHLASCTMKKVNSNGKTLSQSSLRFNSSSHGKVYVENYTFDQDYARKMLASMIVLHEYPLSIVDHTGFRRFISALKPLFNMVTRNTIRYVLC
uniref:BED-type domain-containing protein n=1 Tax=Triticum urartu TaxID=4572 RepID=A0A8R7U149_TRIUA